MFWALGWFTLALTGFALVGLESFTVDGDDVYFDLTGGGGSQVCPACALHHMRTALAPHVLMHCMRIACALHVHRMGSACALLVLCQCSACALLMRPHVHCGCTAHDLHLHCVCTA